MKISNTLALLFVTVVLAACGGAEAPADEDRQQNILAAELQEVQVTKVGTQPFFHEIVSNGKITAGKYADLYWNVDGYIAKINTANGRHVSKGDAIASLDAVKLKNAFDAASASLEQSKLAMQDVIIGQGYNPQSDSIPESVLKLAQVKSGYLQSLANYNSSKYDYESSVLKSPISGVVANLTDRESNPATHGRAFCRVIDQNSLCAEFTILESEVSLVKIGESVEVTAFSVPDRVWMGRITEINPFVESSGMLKVKADILNCNGLYEGMNTSLKIRKDVGKLLAVPKTSVVFRSGRAVVFTAKDGVAHWHYVETAEENSEYIAVTSGINEGDSVIFAGNTFLADRSQIKY